MNVTPAQRAQLEDHLKQVAAWKSVFSENAERFVVGDRIMGVPCSALALEAVNDFIPHGWPVADADYADPASLERGEAAVNAFCSTERIRIQTSIFLLLIVLVCLSAAAIAQKAPPSKPFERFDGCVLEPDEWTDGDSFRVQLPDSRLETFRLYFCGHH